MLDLDPRAPGPHYWQTSFGKVRARMCDELPDSVEGMAAEYVDRQTEWLTAQFDRARHRVELAASQARLLTTLGLEVR